MRWFNPFHWRRSADEFETIDLDRRETCVTCQNPLGGDETYAALGVCGRCGHHYVIPAALRIRSLVDEGSFRQTDRHLASTDPLGFQDERPYLETIAETQDRLQMRDAVVTGSATIAGQALELAVLDFRFMGGSMGVVVGEKVARAADRAADRHRPFVTIVTSGGARMQEGMFSLMQMAKTASAIERMKAAGSIHLSIMASPTTGGVLASFASLGDVILAEPDALIGFAGPRVVEELLGEPLPPESHCAEFLFDHGLVDAIVPRTSLTDWVTTVLGTLSDTGKQAVTAAASSEGLPPDREASRSAWEIVQAVRSGDRPTTLETIAAVSDQFVELHGDQQQADDPAVVVGLASIAGRPVAVAGFERGRGHAQAERRFGRPVPAGYRKAQRLLRLAVRLKLPVVTFIDTPGAYPGIESEAEGLAAEIARTLAMLSSLRAPVISVVIGEGGSGGALALAIGDRVLMQEGAYFSVIAPEGASAILYRDGSRAADLAESMKVTALDLLAMGIVDIVLPDPATVPLAEDDTGIAALRQALIPAIDDLSSAKISRTVSRRQRRLREAGSQHVLASRRWRKRRSTLGAAQEKQSP
jgi:acyl-CoA carboxylase subunit beta